MTVNQNAARLALLAARAGVPGPARLPPVPWLDAGLHPIADDDVITYLSGVSRPIRFVAVPVSGGLQFDCRALTPESPDYGFYESGRRFVRSVGGFMRFLGPGTSYDVNAPLVYCVGGGGELLVPISDVRLWYEDYYTPTTSYRADEVDNPHCRGLEEYQRARQLGAAGVLLLAPSEASGVGVDRAS